MGENSEEKAKSVKGKEAKGSVYGVSDLTRHLNKLSKTKEAREKKLILSSFFKTKKGEYAEGDIFLGITVPALRGIVKDYYHLSLTQIEKLLNNPIHELRFSALLILIKKYEEAKKRELSAAKLSKRVNVISSAGRSVKSEPLLDRKTIVDFYLKNARLVNNWDLVDLSSHKILGDYLSYKKESEVDSVLIKLARSENLWERRIAIVSTWAFIKSKSKREVYMICEELMEDEEDLIHKACGWMLREVGKRISEEELEFFLKKNIQKIPKTTLRYALEKFAKSKRLYYYSLARD